MSKNDPNPKLPEDLFRLVDDCNHHAFLSERVHFLRGVKPATKLVLAAILRYAKAKPGQDWSCHPSVETLSKVTAISRKHTIHDALNELESLGWIIRRRDGNRRNNTYWITAELFEAARVVPPGGVRSRSDMSESATSLRVGTKSDMSESDTVICHFAESDVSESDIVMCRKATYQQHHGQHHGQQHQRTEEGEALEQGGLSSTDDDDLGQPTQADLNEWFSGDVAQGQPKVSPSAGVSPRELCSSPSPEGRRWKPFQGSPYDWHRKYSDKKRERYRPPHIDQFRWLSSSLEEQLEWAQGKDMDIEINEYRSTIPDYAGQESSFRRMDGVERFRYKPNSMTKAEWDELPIDQQYYFATIRSSLDGSCRAVLWTSHSIPERQRGWTEPTVSDHPLHDGDF